MNYNYVTALPTDRGTEALVVFSGRADLPWLRCLRAGFRHCFVALRDGPRWVIYEPLSHRTVISVAEPAEGFDLAGWFALFGHAVVPACVEAGPPRPAPWGPFTCVEAVKRVLGIRRRRIVTPWQLYRYLSETGQSQAEAAAADPAEPIHASTGSA